MAITAESWDKAEVTYCYETQTRLGVQTTKRLPWAIVRFPGDEREFIAPANALGVAAGPHADPAPVALALHMLNAPFPHSVTQGPRQAADAPGPFAVHFLPAF